MRGCMPKPSKTGAMFGSSVGCSFGFLPTYSPQLNIAEVLWRKLKYEWLRPEDYADKETLRHAVWQALMAVGGALNIAFSDFTARQNNLT